MDTRQLDGRRKAARYYARQDHLSKQSLFWDSCRMTKKGTNHVVLDLNQTIPATTDAEIGGGF